jgi:hypothetical protein
MTMTFSALVLTAVLVAATPAAAQGTADLIVKLRGPASLATADARDAAAARLSQETGLPLRAIGLTSGGELMLGIDHAVLAERLTAAARTLPGVVSAETSRGPTVVLETEAGSGPPALAAIGDRLAQATGTPVNARFKGNAVVVEASQEQLVGQATRRLQGLPEVAYAQPNFAVGINPPPDPMIRKPL